MYPASPASSSTSRSRPKKFVKIGNGNACEVCRARKIKCDGDRPACTNCKKRSRRCIYTSTTAPNQGFDTSGWISGANLHILGYGPDHASFAEKLSDVINEKLGILSCQSPSEIPLKDAPLFGHMACIQANSGQAEAVLPPRRQADQLMDIYWQHVQQSDLCLDKDQFDRCYQALYAGSSLKTDERIFMSTLNILFAFSTQVQESLPSDHRSTVGGTYFQRAWDLLRPEYLMWEPGSPEMVECLILMSRYLQCFSNPHQTFMVLGAAMRIAQSIGLPFSASQSNDLRQCSLRWRQRLWKRCCFTEMIISWELGRSTAATLATGCALSEGLLGRDDYFTKTMELFEIVRHIRVVQSPVASAPDRLGLSRAQPKAPSYCDAMTEFESCLSKWEQLRFNPDGGDNLLTYQISLRLRYLHARLILYRPVLARHCFNTQLPKSAGAQHADPHKERLMQAGSFSCIVNAQDIISLINEHASSGDAIGVIPWWHRMFHLHVAGMVLLAAMLRAELFTTAVSESWCQLIKLLRSHEHLSPYNPRCTALLQSLANKISGNLDYDTSVMLDNSTDSYFQDSFHDSEFNVDMFLFGENDSSWLENMNSAP